MNTLGTTLAKYKYPSSQELIERVLHDSSLTKRTRFLRTQGLEFRASSSPQSESTWALTSIEKDFSEIKNACEALSEQFLKRVQCNAYFTPKGCQGLPAHYDLHDILVLQLEGSKNWQIWKRFRKSVSLNTLKNDESQNLPVWTASSPSQNFFLTAGQTLFLKAGEPHVAMATQESSLHLSFGIYND